MSSKDLIAKLLTSVDIELNGSRPWDIQVHDERLYRRVLSGGSLAAGESYMDGWWDVADLTGFFARALGARIDAQLGMGLETAWHFISGNLFNMQSLSGSKEVVDKHYDLGNDLYMSFLDPYNQYTCGYFKDTEDLNVAQEQKLDLICRKLELKSGETVLDIGCGWGGFAKFAAERYGAIVTGISISEEQLAYAREYCAGLPVTFLNKDYRDMTGSFDKVVSVGMCEHVGYKNYRTYLEVAARCLKDDGLFLLHCIGSKKSSRATDPWIDKYIFQNGMLPSVAQIGKAMEGIFVMEDWHNFGAYYEKTLEAWSRNFDANWPKLAEKYGGERFYRMWKYYFHSCAGAFRARDIQLWQVVLSKKGVPGGYRSVR